jgi:hypothetical protein
MNESLREKKEVHWQLLPKKHQEIAKKNLDEKKTVREKKKKAVSVEKKNINVKTELDNDQ